MSHNEHAKNFMTTVFTVLRFKCNKCTTHCYESIPESGTCMYCYIQKNLAKYLMANSLSLSSSTLQIVIKLMQDEFNIMQDEFNIMQDESKQHERTNTILTECKKRSVNLHTILELAGKKNIHPIKSGEHLRINRDGKVRLCYRDEMNQYNHISEDILYVHGSSGSREVFKLCDTTMVDVFRHVNYVTSDGNIFTSYHGYTGVFTGKHYEAYCKLTPIND